jgi:hypothetical protein
VTTAADQPRRRPLHTLAMLLGHYSITVSPAASTVITAVVIYRAAWPRPADIVLLAITSAVTVVTLISQLCRDFYHDRQLCLRCLNDAPMLNPQAAVDKHINTLRRVHFARWRIALLPAFLLVPFIVAGMPLSGWPWPARAALIASAVLGYAGSLYMDYATVTHRRLQPWCPWCKRRGFGGEDLPAPVPDPTVKASR